MQAIDRATGYLDAAQDFLAFQKDTLIQDAVIRNIEIIGEAVNKIGAAAPGFTARHPEIPWAQMRGMRNVAIHEYFFVDLALIWSTVKHDFPTLRNQLATLRKSD